jgi:hypothetical protein
MGHYLHIIVELGHKSLKNQDMNKPYTVFKVSYRLFMITKRSILKVVFVI